MKIIELGNVRLRPVVLRDAKLIFDFRSSPSSKRFLNNVPTLENQRQWLREYFERASIGSEHYFIIENSRMAVGTIRISHIEPEYKTFEWGSWFVRKGQHPFVAITSVLLLYELGFDDLGLETAFFEVRKENYGVLRFHQSYGAICVGEIQQSMRFELRREDFDPVRTRWRRMLGAQRQEKSAGT